jgi:hypothetical protein
MYSWISSHMHDISMYQCIYVSTNYIRNMYSCRRFSNASNFFSTESVDPVPKHKHLSKTSIHFHVIKRGSKWQKRLKCTHPLRYVPRMEESRIWFPRWPFSQSSSIQNKPKKTLTLYQNWDCVKKMIQQKTVKLHLFSFFMVSYMCLCIKLQSNPKSLCEDSFRTQLKTRESLCTSSKLNASGINGNYATATSFTLLPSAAAITNIYQKVS